MSDTPFVPDFIPTRCPRCGHEEAKSLAWLKANVQDHCAGCNEPLVFDGPALIKQASDAVDEGVAGLKRQIGAANKSLKRRK